MNSEFELIARLQRVSGDVPNDDCAVIEGGYVVSVDSFVQDVHFRLETFSLEEIGHKALAASLSDIAAMGAEARAALVALQIPSGFSSEDAERLYIGLSKLAKETGTKVIGGNISKAKELSVSITAIGSTDRPITRQYDGEQAEVFVCTRNGLGGAALGLRDSAGRIAQNTPFPLLKEGLELQGTALAMIDISDGLVQDAGHLAAASGGEISIDSSLIPVFEGATLEDALYGGEDYALLYFAEPSNPDELKIGNRIGSYKKSDTTSVFVDGKITSGGFDHLR